MSSSQPLHTPARAGFDAGGGQRRRGLPELEDCRWAPREAGSAHRRRRSGPGAGAPQAMAAPPATAVQRLFEACREVFTGAGGPGAVPPPAGVERIKSVLGN